MTNLKIKNMAENKKETELTKQEDIEIEKLISYYSSLDLDVEPNEDNPKSERDVLNGLIKLKKFYNKKHGRK